MSAHRIIIPDDEREASSIIPNEQLDRLLFDRHFRNDPIRQITPNNSSTSIVDITPNNNNINPTTPDTRTRHSSHQTTTKPSNTSTTNNYKNCHYPINICNVNIQGFNDPIKRFQFLDHCSRSNFDIIGLSELHFSSKSNTRDELLTKNDRYDCFWSIDPTPNLTAGGVGLLINKHLSKHIRSWQEYKGRIIYVDLFFKQKNKVRLVQIYNPPRKHHQLSEEIFRKLEDIIIIAQKENFQIIIMGDFNENMNEFYTRKREGRSIRNYKFNFLRLMNKYNLLNTVELFNNPPFVNTWNNKSRIDGTFVSSSLPEHIIMSMIDTEPTNFTTDHTMVITKFNRKFFFKPTKQGEQRNCRKNQRRHYQFDKMTDEMWKSFKRATKLWIRNDSELNNFNPHDNADVHTINFLNNKLEECILKAAKDNIPSKLASKGYRSLKAKSLVIIERFLKQCNRIARRLHKTIIDKEGYPNREIWSTWTTTANKIVAEYELKVINWTDTVNDQNLKSCQKDVNYINKFLLNLYKSKEAITTRQQIGRYFEQRCNDLKENQSRMIDSLLERPYRKIHLDRVMLDKDTLSLDPDEIETKVTSHFQTYAGPSNETSTIPEEWKADYEPNQMINEDWYKDQLTHVSLQELNAILGKCPNDKAAGVSTITYEFVKHSSKEFKRKLLLSFNMCLDLGLSPDKWK